MGKIKLNKDGLKGIFVNHVEKMVLAVVLLVFVAFVYVSWGLEGLPSNQTPDALIQSAQTAEKNIVNPDNSKEVMSTVTVTSGYTKRVEDALIPTNAVLYAGFKPPTPYYGQDGVKRQDPKLLPPEKVEVYAITGGLAYRMTNPDEDELAKVKNATQPPKKVAKKDDTRKKSGMGMMGMTGYSDPSEGGLAAGAGMSSAGMAGMAGMSGMGMPGGMPGSDQGGGTTGGILANPVDRPGFIATQGAIAKSRSAVVVKAVVPWKKQWEEYDQKFSSAIGFNPARDTPRYLSFTAERLEVSDDPNAPLDWSKAIRVNHTFQLLEEIKEEYKPGGYAGFAQDIADPRYLQNWVLTFPIPPFINRNLEPLALHSLVPKISPNMMTMADGSATGQDNKKKKDDKKKSAKESDVPNDVPGNVPGGGSVDGGAGFPGLMGGGGGYPGSDSGGMGMPEMGGPGMPGMPGMGGSGMPGMGMPGMGGSGMSGMAGMAGMAEGMGMSGDSGSGMMSGGYGMGGYGDASTALIRGPVVPYLLIRFFDFSVEPGKKYRYRVQTLVEDPNHPQYPQFDLSDRYLDDTVKKRLNQVAVEEKEKKQRQFFLRSDWSEPSDPVAVEIKPRSLAGQVAAQRFGVSPEKTQDKLVLDEPEAKMMSVVWDAVHATDVTGITDVFRGTYLNFKANGTTIHPVLLLFKSLENFDFQTDRLVADIRGGDELAGGDKDHPLLTPGQYALIDDNGQIIVRSEFDDWDDFRKLALPELPDSVGMGYPGIGSGDGESDMGYPGGMPGTMGGPGVGKKGKAGRSSMKGS